MIRNTRTRYASHARNVIARGAPHRHSHSSYLKAFAAFDTNGVGERTKVHTPIIQYTDVELYLSL